MSNSILDEKKNYINFLLTMQLLGTISVMFEPSFYTSSKAILGALLCSFSPGHVTGLFKA